MTQTIGTLFVPGKVTGKGRPRFARMGNFVRTYTPKETENVEGIIRTMFAAKVGGVPPSEDPVALKVTATIAPPQSWPNWKREAALANRIEPTTKPDLDNIVKLVKDALNKVAWQDDAQVTSIDACKVYGSCEGLRIDIYRRVGFMTAQNAKRAA